MMLLLYSVFPEIYVFRKEFFSGKCDVVPRVDRGAVFAGLEVQMIAEGVAGQTDPADELSGRDRFTGANIVRRHMRIQGGQTVSVVDEDVVAVTRVVFAAQNGTAGSRQNVRSVVTRKVDRKVEILDSVDRTPTVFGRNIFKFYISNCIFKRWCFS